jgi:signal transduction histidine kinase
LPLARSLIELHGGSLQLESEEDIGTVVTLWLPAERVLTTLPDRQQATG